MFIPTLMNQEAEEEMKLSELELTDYGSNFSNVPAEKDEIVGNEEGNDSTSEETKVVEKDGLKITPIPNATDPVGISPIPNAEGVYEAENTPYSFGSSEPTELNDTGINSENIGGL